MSSRFLVSTPLMLRLVFGSAAVMGLVPSAAIAQVEAVAPYSVVTTANDASLRCGDSGTYYVVAGLKSGTVLKVDGQSSGFLRVAYPAGSRALVPADEGAPDPTGKVVKLTKPSRLKAANAAIARNSWNSLLDHDLTPGTELPLIDTIKNDDGKPTYYAVTPPAEARAFISASLVRKATPEEVAAAGSAAPPPAVAPSTPKITIAPAPGSGLANTVQPVVAPPASNPGTAHVPAATDPNLKPAMPGVGGKMGEPPVPPSPVEPSTVIVPSTPAPTPAPTEAPATAKVEPPKPNQSEVLIKLFERVQKQPLAEAELEGAVSQFESYINTLGSSDADRRMARGMGRYVEALKLRMEIREAQRANAVADKELAAKQAETNARLTELQKQRYYSVIGRLMSSTIYDGVRQPLMFRIVSPEPGFMRTLGYIVPDKSFDLASKIGLVVGIDGDSKRDEALKANVITPRHIDIVSLSPMGEVLGTEPLAPSGVTIPPAATTPASGTGTGQMRPAVDLDGTGWRPAVPKTPPAPGTATPSPASEPQKP
ncbi:MAG: hypothetical protein ACREJO_04360 [Phycisphaerales bacterium]